MSETETTSLPNSALPAALRVTRGQMLWFVLLLVVANLVWAGQPTAIKFIPQLGPFAKAFLPFFFITPLLVPFLWLWRNPDAPSIRPTLSDWGQFAIAGIVGQLVCQLGMTWGSEIGQASSCTIMYLMLPVITAVMASLYLKERLTVLRIVCLGIGLSGVLVMSANDLRDASLFESNYFRGNMLFLVGCVGAAFYNVYCKGLMQKFNERDILIYSYITAAPASLPILLWKEPGAFQGVLQLDASAWIAFSYLFLLVYGITMLMLFYVLQFLPVSVVLASTYLIPVFGVVIGMTMLGDRLNLYQVFGGLVVLTATVLIMKFEADSLPDSSNLNPSPGSISGEAVVEVPN